MPGKESAGILLYRFHGQKAEVLLVHPGGPFWKNKDAGVWTIPKGEVEPGEEPLDTAIREFREETGSKAGTSFILLTPIRQKAGKLVRAWAMEGDLDTSLVRCNTFEMEWPPRSGRKQSFPEIDRAEWFNIADAKGKINQAQIGFIDELFVILKNKGSKEE